MQIINLYKKIEKSLNTHTHVHAQRLVCVCVCVYILSFLTNIQDEDLKFCT